MLKIDDYFVTNVRPIMFDSPTAHTMSTEYIKSIEEHGIDSQRVLQISAQRRLTNNKRLIHILKEIQDSKKISDSDWEASETEAPEILWNLFLCYRIIVWDENMQTKDLMNQFHLSGEETLCNMAWEYVEYVSMMYADQNLRTMLSVDNKRICETLYTDSLFHAFMYQLLFHIKNGEYGKAGCSIASCKNCGIDFIRQNKKTKLCPCCGSVAGRSKSYRDRKKGGISNEP